MAKTFWEKGKMKLFGTLSIFFVLLSTVLSSESGDFQDLIEEKARIKAEIETKPSPGHVIFAAVSVTTKLKPSATKVIEEANVSSTPTPTPQPKPKQSNRDDHNGKDQELDDEEEEIQVSKKKKDTRKSNKKDKKSSSDSKDSDDEGSDDVNELPKRLFRPRFRAESSANTIKMFSSTTLFVTLSISLMAVYLI